MGDGAFRLPAGNALAPQNSQQLVQQGGSLLLHGNEILYAHKDSGVLMITDVEALLAVIQAETSTAPTPTQS
jgi:hypothetical protein